MKIKLFNAIILFLMILLVSAPNSMAEGVKGGKANTLSKTSGSPSYARFNINKISTWIKNDGETDVNQNGNSGFVYPKGTNKACVFQSGFLWGGKFDGQIRVGGSTYNQGLGGGAILNGTPEDPQLDHVRIYRVRRDYKTGNLSPEAQDEGLSVAEVFAQYEKDWNEWPVAYGAPYEDVDGNGSYDAAVDIPGEPGADQTVWFVANDFDSEQLYGSLPMKIEMQATIFGYNRIGPLGSTVFRKYMIINKSSTDITDFYVCMWSDPDVGDATDDYVGADTSLSLGYCYNGTPNDATYELIPPATGFDFFQGPIVDGEATDTAKFLGRRVAGKKNLAMSAYFFFINSDPVYSDPTLTSYAEGTLEMYNLFQGKIGTTGQPFIDPTNNQPTKFTLYGDPNAGTGWLDGMLHPPGDRRFGQVAGPFTMAAGDTQEVVVGQLAAGASPGINNLQAITLLKQYDVVAQGIYDADFVVPGAPKQPTVEVVELDESLVLNWGADLATVATTESHDNQGYVFQGYNVYQLPTANAGIDEAVKLATYDVIDGIKNIVENAIDRNTGVEISVVSQTGTDSGIKRFHEITKDHVKNAALVNGSRYYFAVTSYAYTLDEFSVPRVLENDLIPITVVTRSTDPGVRYGAAVGSSFDATHSSGASDGFARYNVVDPTKLTGHDYKVTFDTDSTGTYYTLTDVTTGEVKLSKQREIVGDNAPIVDGIQVHVSGAPSTFKDFQVIANAAGPLDPPDGASASYNGFPGLGTPHTGVQQSTNDSRWMVYSVRNAQNAYSDFIAATTQYSGGFGEANMGIGSIVPDDFEIRFTANGGKGFDNWESQKVIDVPFEMWNIGKPADPSDDYQIFPFILDNNANGVFDLNADDHAGSSADNDPYTDGIYSIQPLDKTPGSQGYNDLLAVIQANEAEINGLTLWAFKDTDKYKSVPGLMRLSLMAWNNGDVTDRPSWTAEMPEVGTIFRIMTTKPNVAGSDEFTFSVPKNTNDPNLAKEDVKEINVFPNPYYGVNSEELNKYQRFVTFNHLPAKATIRIFNLAGQLVRTIDKNEAGQFTRWDLLNGSGLPVASGLYIVYIDMPDLGTTKILKVAIIQEQQVLDRF